MKLSRHVFSLSVSSLLFAGAVSPAHAEEEGRGDAAAATAPSAPAGGTVFLSTTAEPFFIPDDINGHRTIIAPPPVVKRPVSIAIYDGPGSGGSGIDNVTERAAQLPGASVTRITAEEMPTADLSRFDIVVFSGGSGSAQAKAIGDAGRANVKRFVENGGGFLGICAGAYLATAGYDWSLGIINAKTVSPKWRRGRTFVDIEVDTAGRSILGEVADTFKCRYANGPIITAMGREDLPPFTTVAWFRSEIAENGTPAGVMVNSPAAAYAPYGKGRVFIVSSHTENTPGLENFVPRALLWLGQADATPGPLAPDAMAAEQN